MEPKENKMLESVWKRLADKARNETELRMAFDELLKFTINLEAKYKQMKTEARRHSLRVRKSQNSEP